MTGLGIGPSGPTRFGTDTRGLEHFRRRVRLFDHALQPVVSRLERARRWTLGERQDIRDPRRSRHPRTHVYRRRRSSGWRAERSGRRHQLQLLAASLAPHSSRDRPHGDCGTCALHHRRCHAAGVLRVDVGRTFDVAAPVRTTTRFGNRASSSRDPCGGCGLSSGLSLDRPSRPALPSSRRCGRRSDVRRCLTTGMQTCSIRTSQSHFVSSRRSTATPTFATPIAVHLRFSMVVVALVLLIACANPRESLAGSSFRTAARARGSTGVRGLNACASARQLLTESLLLSSLGAALGLALAFWGSRLLVSQLSTTTNNVFLDLAIYWRVLGFTASSAVATAVLFGTAPALRGARLEPTETLKALAREVIGEGRLRPAHLPPVLQVAAVARIFSVAAGLFLRTFSALCKYSTVFPSKTHPDCENRSTSGTHTRQRTAAVVRANTGGSSAGPGCLRCRAFTCDTTWERHVEQPDRAPRPSSAVDSRPADLLQPGSSGWFKAYGTRLLEGRDFTESRSPGSPPVAIVNEAFARRFNGGKSPIGMKVLHPGPTTREVVGYVKDAAYQSLKAPAPPTLYVAHGQETQMQPDICLSVRAVDGSAARLAHPLVTALTGVHGDSGYHLANARGSSGRHDGAGASPGLAFRILRRARSAPGRLGPLRCHRLQRQPAAIRNRHPDRARRQA